jgi:hypothetical protein
MASNLSLVLRWFYRKVFPLDDLDFDDLLLQAVKSALGKSDMDAEAYVYPNRTRYWSELLQRLDTDPQLGRTPLFEVRDRASRRIRWSLGDVANARSVKDKRLAARLSARPVILGTIDLLSDRQFEALGCVICQYAGATHTKLTPRGNEGGIDFFAQIQIHAKCHVFGGYHRPLRIVGQAKKYQDPAHVDKVKEFVTTLDEIRNQNPSVEGLVPAWFRAGSGPIIGWFVAHSGVQSGGITKARNHGIIVSDSLDLAEVAVLSRYLDDSFSPEQRANVLLQQVKDLLPGA